MTRALQWASCSAEKNRQNACLLYWVNESAARIPTSLAERVQLKNRDKRYLHGLMFSVSVGITRLLLYPLTKGELLCMTWPKRVFYAGGLRLKVDFFASSAVSNFNRLSLQFACNHHRRSGSNFDSFGKWYPGDSAYRLKIYNLPSFPQPRCTTLKWQGSPHTHLSSFFPNFSITNKMSGSNRSILLMAVWYTFQSPEGQG